MMNSTDRVPITSPHILCRGHLGSSQSRLDRIAITSHFSLARGVSLPAEPVGSSRLGNVIGGSIDLAPGQHRPGDARHLVGQGDRGQARGFAVEQLLQPFRRTGCLAPGIADDAGRPDHQQTADIGVAGLRDAAQSVLAATRILPWNQPQPCRQLAAVPESRGIGDRGGNRRGRNRTDAGDGGEVAAGFVRLVPGEDSPFQRINTFVAFVDLVSNLPESDAGQLWYFSVVEAGDEILDLAAPLRRDDTEFGKMSPYGVESMQ